MSNLKEKNQSNFDATLLGMSLDRGASAPLHRQLTDALRQIIQTGRGQPGQRLPSSRQLAMELSVSRATVLTAFDQLRAEGYLTSRTGAGMFIAGDMPHLSVPEPIAQVGAVAPITMPLQPFGAGAPDVALFPYRQWARHLDAVWRRPEPALLHTPDLFGWYPLRTAIAEHLRAWRGVNCSPDQVIITSGSSEAFGLIARYLGVERPVHVESPCYKIMLDRFERAGLNCRPVPVDQDGLDPALLDLNAAAAIVTPSRQYPLGMTMPVARRLTLLEWAEAANGLIIEDDYDSEFRYQGQPPPALASLDQRGRTIYVGSFSKLFSPALRLGYFVVPAGLVAPMRSLVKQIGLNPSLTPQPALARFMQSGEFATHVRRMRRVYGKRHRHLFSLIEQDLAGYLIPEYQPTGLHVLCRLGPKLAHLSDQQVVAAAKTAGLRMTALSQYAQTPPTRQGLVLGFAAFDEDHLNLGVEALKTVLHDLA